MTLNFKKWRESAALILAAKSVFKSPNKYNYKIVCLKRSSRSAFMPNTYVFPGGNISQTDTSLNWWNVFENAGLNLKSLDNLRPPVNNPDIFENYDKDAIPKYLSLRITAIRETFEECGVLMCRKNNSGEIDSNWAQNIEDKTILKWQKKVHNDPNEFIELCKQYDIYPDVFSLKLWAHWMSPPYYPKLFNTIFFISTINSIPDSEVEEKEIQDIKWSTPDEYLDDSYKQRATFPPPQFYEFCRLKNFTDIDVLSKFAKERSAQGAEKYIPFRINTKKGIVSILPGDELYPEVYDPNVEVNMDELPQTNKKHRMFHKSEYTYDLIIDKFSPGAGHLTPVMPQN